MTDGVRIPPPGAPVDMAREAFVCDLLGDLRGLIAARRDPCYGALAISDEQVCEMATAVATMLLASRDVRPLPAAGDAGRRELAHHVQVLRELREVEFGGTAQGEATAKMMSNYRGRR